MEKYSGNVMTSLKQVKNELITCKARIKSLKDNFKAIDKNDDNYQELKGLHSRIIKLYDDTVKVFNQLKKHVVDNKLQSQFKLSKSHRSYFTRRFAYLAACCKQYEKLLSPIDKYNMAFDSIKNISIAAKPHGNQAILTGYEKVLEHKSECDRAITSAQYIIKHVNNKNQNKNYKEAAELLNVALNAYSASKNDYVSTQKAIFNECVTNLERLLSDCKNLLRHEEYMNDGNVQAITALIEKINKLKSLDITQLGQLEQREIELTESYENIQSKLKEELLTTVKAKINTLNITKKEITGYPGSYKDAKEGLDAINIINPNHLKKCTHVQLIDQLTTLDTQKKQLDTILRLCNEEKIARTNMLFLKIRYEKFKENSESLKIYDKVPYRTQAFFIRGLIVDSLPDFDKMNSKELQSLNKVVETKVEQQITMLLACQQEEKTITKIKPVVEKKHERIAKLQESLNADYNDDVYREIKQKAKALVNEEPVAISNFSAKELAEYSSQLDARIIKLQQINKQCEKVKKVNEKVDEIVNKVKDEAISQIKSQLITSINSFDDPNDIATMLNKLDEHGIDVTKLLDGLAFKSIEKEGLLGIQAYLNDSGQNVNVDNASLNQKKLNYYFNLDNDSQMDHKDYIDDVAFVKAFHYLKEKKGINPLKYLIKDNNKNEVIRDMVSKLERYSCPPKLVKILLGNPTCFETFKKLKAQNKAIADENLCEILKYSDKREAIEALFKIKVSNGFMAYQQHDFSNTIKAIAKNSTIAKAIDELNKCKYLTLDNAINLNKKSQHAVLHTCKAVIEVNKVFNNAEKDNNDLRLKDKLKSTKTKVITHFMDSNSNQEGYDKAEKTIKNTFKENLGKKLIRGLKNALMMAGAVFANGGAAFFKPYKYRHQALKKTLIDGVKINNHLTAQM
jgi:uncharacterized protein YejL (UPF0352 family)